MITKLRRLADGKYQVKRLQVATLHANSSTPFLGCVDVASYRCAWLRTTCMFSHRFSDARL